MRKPRPIPLAEFLPWTAAHFPTQEIRDRFLLLVAATLPAGEVEVEPMRSEAHWFVGARGSSLVSTTWPLPTAVGSP